VLDDLPLGAHLTSPRRGYLHHGVYAGNGRVIHYGGFNRMFTSCPIEEVSLEEFTLGRGLAVKPWVCPKFLGNDVVERARSRIGENRYRLFSNNCEHFTEWCIGGKSCSPQVEALKARVKKGFARFAPFGNASGGSNVLPA
jgi:Lecithin retinol acyltransferase